MKLQRFYKSTFLNSVDEVTARRVKPPPIYHIYICYMGRGITSAHRIKATQY